MRLPAGKGPHGSCKHIAALCYCLVEYVTVGAVRSHETCTAKLQTWSQPRSKNLPGMLVRDINFQKLKQKKVACTKTWNSNTEHRNSPEQPGTRTE